jgi:hypothetical protein
MRKIQPSSLTCTSSSTGGPVRVLGECILSFTELFSYFSSPLLPRAVDWLLGRRIPGDQLCEGVGLVVPRRGDHQRHLGEEGGARRRGVLARVSRTRYCTFAFARASACAHAFLGILAYTQRYSTTTHCPMDLHTFPCDEQVWPITFESFHWKSSDMVMRSASSSTGFITEIDHAVRPCSD